MKLLYISSPSYADCDFPLIKTFQEKGIDVTYIITLAPFSLKSTLFNIKRQIPKTGIFPATEYIEFKQYKNYMDMTKVLISNRVSSKSYSWSYWKETYLLYNLIKKGKFDVIHSDIFMKGIRRKFYGLSKHWIMTFHDPFPHTGENQGNYKKRYHDTIMGSNGYVLLNDKQKSEFCELYDVDPSKVLINRLGVYDNIKAFVKSEWKVKPNNILFFGRVSPYKGIEYLCEAMKLVRQDIPDATLTIAGGGKMYFDIEPYKQLGFIEVINRYIGMEELAELLSRCEISVCPYTDATQSGVIMTSFSLSKPVVASNVGGLGEMVDHGNTGYLVPPKDVKSLANAIVDILKNDNVRNVMKSNISNLFLQGERSWSSIADKYIAYYNQIVNL